MGKHNDYRIRDNDRKAIVGLVCLAVVFIGLFMTLTWMVTS